MERLCKITPVGSDVTYYLLADVVERSKEIDITVTDGKAAWKGNLDSHDFTSLSKRANISSKDVWEESVKALTRQDMGSLVFEYQVKLSGSKMNLTWKKHIASEDIKFQLGSATLQENKDPNSAICKIIEFSLNSVNELSSKITGLNAENERLTAERANALKRLEKCVAAKEQLEVDMYSKFVVVVNDKKSKIRKLQDKVKDLQNGSSDRGEPSTFQAADEKPKRRRLSSSGESDSPAQHSDYETDDEKPTSTQRKTKAKPKSKDQEDDSLILDDDIDMEEENTVISRRKRRQSSMKKQTPSKPVIPKVSSTTPIPDTRSSARKKPPMRKKTSNASSNKSSDDIEAEDLIDDLA